MNSIKVSGKHHNLDLIDMKNSDDEIDLRELIIVIWHGKWLIVLFTLIFAISSVIYAIKLPNIYKSEVLLAPEKNSSQDGGGLASLAGKFGGLASIAGIDLGDGASNKTNLAIEIMKSRQFISKFIEEHKILPELMALTKWNMVNNSLEYDFDIYNPLTKKWTREVNLPYKSKPSMQEAYEVFMRQLTIEPDTKSGTVIISIESISPYLAQKWLTWLVQDINKVMKERDVLEAQKSIDFLESQINKTSVADIRGVLYKLIEEQAKTIMFANVRDEYVFKTIDPAIIPLKKEKPSRGVICIIGSLIGGFFGLMFILVRYFIKQ